jgi:FdhD protein
MIEARRGSKTRVRVRHMAREGTQVRSDWLATEEPLEIQVFDSQSGDLLLTHVTMRTPGSDFELAAGFLHAEGIIERAEQISDMEFCVGPGNRDRQFFNIVSVRASGADMSNREGQRFRTVSSACGVCGKASLDELILRGLTPLETAARIDWATFVGLPDALRNSQAVFAATGGLHGAALATTDGNLLAVREDVGRHNAVDKLLGWLLLNGEAGVGPAVLVVSGRLSFELAQKAVVGRVPILAGVSAPSSLAVDLAREFGLTLAGFVRDGACNLYSRPERIIVEAIPPAVL